MPPRQKAGIDGWQLDRGHRHGGDRDVDHSAEDCGPGRRPVHVLRLGKGCIRNEIGIHRHRGQRLCRIPRGPPTSITLTTAWQRFNITGTLAGGQTGLWIVVRQFAGNSDNWTSGAIYLWGACLQQGNDPKSGYARTWASKATFIAAGIP